MSASVDTLLNQVPYQNRKRVKDDVTRLMLNIKTLLPKIGTIIANTGGETKLAVMSGTIPIYYQSAQYNIPVELYIPLRYPLESPKIYVRPTPNMTIKQNHRHVDLQGLVFLPYLHEWKQDTSNLSALVEITCNVFSIEPPLFAKPSNAPSPVISAYNSASASPITAQASPSPAVLTAYPRPIATSANQSSQITYASSATLYNPAAGISAMGAPAVATATLTPYSSAQPSAVTTYPSATNIQYTPAQPAATPVTAYSPNSFGITATSSSQATATAAAEAHKAKDKRNKLIFEVTSRMRENLHSAQEVLRDELDREFSTERYLEQSNAKAHANLIDLQAAAEQYAEALKLIESRDAELTAWTEGETAKPQLEAEQRLEPFDDLAAQIVKLNGELNAIDDAFYFLERALVEQNNKSINLDSFLKESRRLARQQFMCKATLMKINAAFMQQQSIAAQTHNAQARQANAVGATPPQFYPPPGAPINGVYHPQAAGGAQQWPPVPTASVVPQQTTSHHRGGNRAKLTIL